MITNNDFKQASKLINEKRIEYAKEYALALARYTMPKFESTPFHKAYFKILDHFIHGRIKKLIISCPPQHGKSNGSSIYTPAMMLGRNPDLKIATICYSAGKARKFGRGCKNLIKEPTYQDVFEMRFPTQKDKDLINTAEETEVVGHDGSLKCVGYQGGLTGDPVDVLLMDDLYKDWKEANSPTIRENVIDWYNTVADTRLHNNSQQLIVFTRWHEEDLVGFIEKKETVIELKNWDDISEDNGDVWYKINFEAIKMGEPTEIDPREKGEALWPNRHSLKKLKSARAKDPIKFESLYQGNPESKEGMLYGEFQTYTKPPENIRQRTSYTDCADTGEDYLCSIVYDETKDDKAYVVDIVYTDKAMEYTEPAVASLFKRTDSRKNQIESNNGGRGFARKVNDLVPVRNKAEWFHQSENKEARIISNSATVTETVIMPHDWSTRWPVFYTHVTKFKKIFKANAQDDAPDTLTGITESIHKPRKKAQARWL